MDKEKMIKEIKMEYNHKTMILNPDNWPRGDILPMTRLDKDQPFGKELGVIHRDDPNIVLFANMLEFPKTNFELNRTPCIAYDSIDQLLEDGWVVD